MGSTLGWLRVASSPRSRSSTERSPSMTGVPRQGPYVPNSAQICHQGWWIHMNPTASINQARVPVHCPRDTLVTSSSYILVYHLCLMGQLNQMWRYASDSACPRIAEVTRKREYRYVRRMPSRPFTVVTVWCKSRERSWGQNPGRCEWGNPYRRISRR